jgi:hypothetical protein
MNRCENHKFNIVPQVVLQIVVHGHAMNDARGLIEGERRGTEGGREVHIMNERERIYIYSVMDEICFQ